MSKEALSGSNSSDLRSSILPAVFPRLVLRSKSTYPAKRHKSIREDRALKIKIEGFHSGSSQPNGTKGTSFDAHYAPSIQRGLRNRRRAIETNATNRRSDEAGRGRSTFCTSVIFLAPCGTFPPVDPDQAASTKYTTPHEQRSARLSVEGSRHHQPEPWIIGQIRVAMEPCVQQRQPGLIMSFAPWTSDTIAESWASTGREDLTVNSNGMVQRGISHGEIYEGKEL
ncbi:hypothetical protein K438DRAFT_1777919 [Mycena galopus ATCC 62051]|nr:hypothetical protein K438DRAFT_1777919 [Mycena galopus ATCC 62051]